MRRLTNADFLVMLALVVLGVVGRVGRVEWNFTPIAATAIFAGFYFGRAWLAAAIPMLSLAISNMIEPAHNSWIVAASVYACMLVPAACGRWLYGATVRQWPKWLLGCIAPAVVFFIVTNFAVWYSSSEYAATLAGLAECYTYAIPFFRRMIAGDLFWTGVLMGTYAISHSAQRKSVTVTNDRV